MLPQLGNALAGIGRNAHNGLILQKGAFDLLFHILPDHFHPFGIHHIGLGDDHQTLLDAQQGQNTQVLHRLGHKALVGSHYQHGKVDAAGTGQHIFNEFLMSGHIHDAGLGAVLPVQMGKAQLDGDAPFLFLLQAVGVNAGQRLDQKGFTVVYVSGSADNYVFHWSASFTACAM